MTETGSTDRKLPGLADPAASTGPTRLRPAALRMLRDRLGAGEAGLDDAPSRASAAASIPESRLAGARGLSLEPGDRLAVARGESLRDWIAAYAGWTDSVPDAVAAPVGSVEVRDLLDVAAGIGAAVVPRGGGTSVTGGVTPVRGDRPVIVADMRRHAGLLSFDPLSGLAAFGTGATGPSIEAALAPHGFTLGHIPQSWARATLGGWVAARSVGQQSLGFGRIEALFAGGRFEAPAGSLDVPVHPASAAGPDLRQLVLGSEGRLGILVDASVRAVPRPEAERVLPWFVPNWSAGITVARELVQARVPLAMIRLSDPLETGTLLAIGTGGTARRAIGAYFRLRRLPAEPCLLLVAITGRPRVVSAAEAETRSIVRRHGAVRGPGAIGRAWAAARFGAFDLRAALWDHGYAVDTVESAADWGRVPALVATTLDALRRGLEPFGERVAAFGHLSHVYPSGSSVYVTYVYRRAIDPHETLQRWESLKGAASRAIVAAGGTISHQHGIGRDHLPYLEAEKGALGLDVLRAVAGRLDPDGIMNPGVLLPPP